MKTLLCKDDDTGVRLWSEERREPGGEIVTLYSFDADPPRGLPSHLGPADPADRRAAHGSFDRFVQWFKDNPSV